MTQGERRRDRMEFAGTVYTKDGSPWGAERANELAMGLTLWLDEHGARPSAIGFGPGKPDRDAALVAAYEALRTVGDRIASGPVIVSDVNQILDALDLLRPHLLAPTGEQGE